MSALERTHVSALQELCVKRGISPAYNDTQLSFPPDPPSFACDCTVLDLEARGEGRNKREAKHAAAKKMLERLKNCPDFNTIGTSIVDINSTSPYENKMKDNEIGALMDLCTEFKLGSPKYVPVREEGPSHDRRFTERCYVESFGVEATEKKKKEAKQMVAQGMRSLLTDIISPRADEAFELISDVNEGFARAKSKFQHSESKFVAKLHPDDLTNKINEDYIRYHEYHNRYNDLINQYTTKFWENPEEKLDSLLEAMEVKYSLIPISTKNNDVKIVAINIDMAPPLNITQSGPNYDVAAEKAAQTALHFIGILCAALDEDSAENSAVSVKQFEELVKNSFRLRSNQEK